MTVTAVSHHASGEMTSSHTSGVSSSEDAPAQDGGVFTRSGIHGRVTSDTTQIADTDIVQVQGMGITAGMARQMGLLDAHILDGSLSVGNAVPTQDTPEETPQGSNTGYEGYDRTVDALNSKVDAGTMKFEEATSYETALGQVALAGLTVTEASETLDGIADGSINPDLMPADQRQVIENLQSTVTDAATKSVISEIGQQGFDRLHEIAKGDAEFNSILTQYASMRALGKASHTWSEFLADAEAWSRGDR